MSEIKTNKISSLTSSNSDITLDPDGTGDVVVASGHKLGIGTTSPALPLEVNGSTNVAVFRSDASNSIIQLANSTGTGGDNGTLVGSVGDDLYFRAGDAERVRIDSSGNVLINATSQSNIERVNISYSRISHCGMVIDCTDGTATTAAIKFFNPNGDVGSIDMSGTATSYTTSSDHRLKENVADMTGAIDRVKALAPKRFNFIADADTTVDGFLAHEAQAVVPEAVTGTHNEVDDDDNPVMQGIDQSKLVPLLTGALREAIAKIEALETSNADLEARVTALENA